LGVERSDDGRGLKGGELFMEGNDEVDSLIREFPSLEVNDHLEVKVDTLGHKLLDTDNLDIVEAGREWVLVCQVQLCQLGVGEAVHLPTGHQVSSWKATPIRSELKLTSNSIHFVPFLAASLTASRASRQAAHLLHCPLGNILPQRAELFRDFTQLPSFSPHHHQVHLTVPQLPP
jgi:hypothetical protein